LAYSWLDICSHYLKVSASVLKTLPGFDKLDNISTSMQGAALGLTCKDAFQVFSQNETLALQGQVTELKALLAHHRPPVARASDKLHDARALQDVCDIFDNKYPPDSRLAPVPTEDEAYTPLHMRSIWNNINYDEQDDGLEQNSLQAVIMQVLKNALGDMCADYCKTQSHKTIDAVRHALKGAYEASEWDIFSEQQMQENIVWQAIDNHFREMILELDDWDDNWPKWF